MLLPDMRPDEVAGLFRTPSEAELARIRELLRGLGEDAEFRVRLAALGGLSRVGDPHAVEAIAALWDNPNLRPDDRAEIFAALPSDSPEQHKDILLDAAQDLTLDPELRITALSFLGRIADAEVFSVVSRVSENDPDAGVRELAGQAAAALRARLEISTPAQPELPAAPAGDDSGEG
jgi:HEAT repeat protein